MASLNTSYPIKEMMMNDETKNASRSKWYSFSNIIAIALVAFVIVLFFSPNLKGIVIQNLMHVGFFQPDIPDDPVVKIKQSSVIDAAFKDQKGIVLKLSELKGKVVFINFWATWCPPCIAEMPSIHKLHQKYKASDDVVFLMIDVDRNFESSLEFMNKRKFGLPVFVAETATPVAYFSGSMPTTVILDKLGNVVFRHIGAADYDNSKVYEFIDKLRL